jgi:hypothetical protein
VVDNLFRLSGHIYKLKKVGGPNKNENILFLNYLLCKNIKNASISTLKLLVPAQRTWWR